jgi:tetratricopeptide (TPR) repeat protein
MAEVTGQRLSAGLVDALRLRGLIATQRGAWEEAAGHFQRAIQLAREVTYPWGEALALYHCGLMWGRRGELDHARTQLRAARAIFARLGAEPHRAKVDIAVEEVGRLQPR